MGKGASRAVFGLKAPRYRGAAACPACKETCLLGKKKAQNILQASSLANVVALVCVACSSSFPSVCPLEAVEINGLVIHTGENIGKLISSQVEPAVATSLLQRIELFTSTLLKAGVLAVTEHVCTSDYQRPSGLLVLSAGQREQLGNRWLGSSKAGFPPGPAEGREVLAGSWGRARPLGRPGGDAGTGRVRPGGYAP